MTILNLSIHEYNISSIYLGVLLCTWSVFISSVISFARFILQIFVVLIVITIDRFFKITFCN